MKAMFISVVYSREEVTIYYDRGGEDYQSAMILEKDHFKDTLKKLFPDSYEYCMTYMLKDGEKTGKRYFTPEVLEDFEDFGKFEEIMQGVLDDILGVG